MAWWPFGGGSFLDPEDEQWQIETWRWFLNTFGGLDDLRQSPLVLPTRDFFPPSDTKGHERALHIFECVKRLARVPDWLCELIAQPRSAELLINESTALKAVSHPPAGTFASDGQTVTISYDPAGLDDPGKLIATLAHELAHYILAYHFDQIPGGEALHEPTTDLMTVYLGFGVFSAAACFNFESDMTGWRWSRHGYLSQRAWLFSLAVFLQLRGEEIGLVKPFLKPHLVSDLKEAVNYLRRTGMIAQITAA